VTKFLLGQPLGHVKGAPRKDRGHEDRLDSIFPRQNHLFYGVEMTVFTKVLYCFITFFDELYLSEGFRKGEKLTLNFAISKALKQFGNVTKSPLGQLSGHVKEG